MFKKLSDRTGFGYMNKYRSADEAGLLSPDVLDSLLARYLYQGSDIAEGETYPDVSPYARDATLVNQAYVNSDGLNLDGTDDYASCGNIVPDGPMSFISSITMLGTDSAVIVASDSGTYNFRGLSVSSNKIYYRWSSGSGIIHVYQSDEVQVPAGIKVAIGVSHNLNTDIPVLYANGKAVAATKISEAGAISYPTVSLLMCLGKSGAHSSGYFNGIIHEARLYSVARTADEMYSIYRNLK